MSMLEWFRQIDISTDFDNLLATMNVESTPIQPIYSWRRKELVWKKRCGKWILEQMNLNGAQLIN